MKKKRGPLLLACCVLLLTAGLLLSAVLHPDANTASATSLDAIKEAAEASSDPMSVYRQEQANLQEEMDRLEEEIKTQEGLVGNYQAQLSVLENQMTLKQQQIDVTQAAIDEANALLAHYDEEIAAAEVRLQARQALLQERLVNLYIYGDISLMDVILGADSFADFLTVYDMTELIMNQDQALLEEINAEMALIETYKVAAQATIDEQLELQHDLLDQQADLRDQQNAYYAKLSEANTSIAAMEAMEAEMEQISAALGDEFRALLASSNNTISFGGSLIWPLPSQYTYVSSEYGWRIHPIFGDQRFHSGIDIPAPGGTSIYAAADGKVIYHGWISGYGNTVMIDHGDSLVTLYAHQSSLGSFGVDDYVVAGDTIGYVGTTGNSTGNHLHFEVRVNGESTSPWNYLK